MKTIFGFALFATISLATPSAFGQQFLWSTTKDTTSKWEKYVPLNKVTEEVIFLATTKIDFIEKFDYGFKDWNWLHQIKDLTVFALRSNSGKSSIVIIVCVSKNNVNAIIFSNAIETGNPLTTYEHESGKFTSWFKTLLN